ncbi:MAG: KpsF/GutQ family sugar-phosphate isomerase [Rhizobiales bacterium 24-66-13]|jgi:arabinose-5-phosphate isomerase|nr:MAG: KpsF/GutQ family sugar-phosphate isomerase [Rhizobiales bacterium 35-66-30]OYZ81590.1 MAG: KpsF/GutQ family sugar-phosphate isomerase [Rhizobiales bacterium 24-66-13]OZB10060.1 MAG: KpsF/GutQ family sugar-phosphate isomerase [Rhizobiales bacterium 39-66-18]
MIKETKTLRLSATTAPERISATLASAVRAVELEARGLAQLGAMLLGPLGAAFEKAVDLVMASRGRVVISGMGKSGHIARKIAATMASTGTPSFFMHPAEASHGDLGMVTKDDVLILVSWSGETAEFRPVIEYGKRFSIPMIALTSRQDSTIARASDVALILPSAEEACPNKLAPTTSTTLQLVMGDALAVTLLERRGFSPEQFKVFHPGGKLGTILIRAADLMHSGPALPVVTPDTPVPEVLLAMSAGRLGCVLVKAEDGSLRGIVTDGDIRRAVTEGDLAGLVSTFMTKSPVSVPPSTLASECVALMNERRITVLVISEGTKPVGLLHMHDLLRAGIG